jgi:hypothetical protein
MIPAVLMGGGMPGYSFLNPFAMLMIVAIGSLFLSILIAAEDIPCHQPSKSSHHKGSCPAFIHHSKKVKTQLSYLSLHMNDPIQIENTLPVTANHGNKPIVSKHYTCPPTSLDSLRKRYGKYVYIYVVYGFTYMYRILYICTDVYVSKYLNANFVNMYINMKCVGYI